MSKKNKKKRNYRENPHHAKPSWEEKQKNMAKKEEHDRQTKHLNWFKKQLEKG